MATFEGSNKDRRFLARCMGLAWGSDHERVKIGAMVIKGSSVLGVGFNTMRNHPDYVFDKLAQSSEHAEAAALRRAGSSAEGATLYVARTSLKDDRPLECRPCPFCRSNLYSAGIKRVVWTTNLGIAEERFGPVLTWPREVLCRRDWQNLPSEAREAFAALQKG